LTTPINKREIQPTKTKMILIQIKIINKAELEKTNIFKAIFKQ